MKENRFAVYNAIKALQPYAQFSVKNNDYSTLEWYDDPTVIPIPTREEVEAEIARQAAEYTANEYQRKRAEAYPSIADQLDTIFHQGLDVWKAQIQAVKDRYPKE